MRNVISAAAAAAMMLSAGAASAASLYSNTFSSNTDGFILTGSAGLENAFNGSDRFLGGLTQGSSATLVLDTTGLTSITLNFDLYGLLSLDGDSHGPDIGGDRFTLSVLGSSTLLDKSFTNFANNVQSYGPNASNPARTGSDTDLYGHFGQYWSFPDGGDTTYHLSYTFATTGNSTSIVFTGNSQQEFADEHFGIDNVVVNDAGGVPEPATWAMMLMGFGGIGAAMRNRRRTVVLSA